MATGDTWSNGTAYLYLSSDSSEVDTIVGWISDGLTSAEIASFSEMAQVAASIEYGQVEDSYTVSLDSSVDTYYGIIVVVDAASEYASWITTTVSYANNIRMHFDSNATPTQLSANKTQISTEGTPEPTSGILLLLGATCLTLRRRRQ